MPSSTPLPSSLFRAINADLIFLIGILVALLEWVILALLNLWLISTWGLVGFDGHLFTLLPDRLPCNVLVISVLLICLGEVNVKVRWPFLCHDDRSPARYVIEHYLALGLTMALALGCNAALHCLVRSCFAL